MDSASPQFAASRQKEIIGLLKMGVFQLVVQILSGARLFNSRFVDEVKNLGTEKAFEKSRLVVQAYNDSEKDIVLTQSPTIQRISQRLIVCFAASLGNVIIKLYLRDVTQAYVQSISELNRDFYIRPPHELAAMLGASHDCILKMMKPLYGVPEAENHWFATYQKHHIQRLGMSESTYDSCFLYRAESLGIVGLQIDDTLILVSNAFAADEEETITAAGIKIKQRDCLIIGIPMKFNGIKIELHSDESITLRLFSNNISLVKNHGASSTSSRGMVRENLAPKDQYIAQRARGAYTASICQPEASFDLSYAAQSTGFSSDDIASLNKRLQWQIDNATRGLRYVKLDLTTLQLIIFTDSFFVNNKDLSFQIGYVICLADAAQQVNVIHWSFVKCKRVTRSVLASELYAMTHGFDLEAVAKTTIKRILRTDISLIICTDSKSLYECFVRLGTTQKKRLMIDVMCLRQSYERREITEIK